MLLLKALALAASASAFLVVPETSPPKDKEGDDSMSILPVDSSSKPDVTLMSYKNTASIPCGSCAGLNAHIEVELAVKDGKTLTLNGYDAWPTRNVDQTDTTALVKAVGLDYIEKIDYMTITTTDKETGIRVIGFKIFRVGETNAVTDIHSFFITVFETSPEHDIAMLGEIIIEKPSKVDKDKPKHHHKGSKEQHKEHWGHNSGMQMHHHQDADKDKDQDETLEYDEGCKSHKCYFEQSVDQCWAEVGCWMKGHKCTHDKSNLSPNPNAGPHLDTDSFWQLPKAIVLFVLFIIFVSIITLALFTIVLSPLIAIVYVMWRMERKKRLANSGAYSRVPEAEAEEGEKSGLLDGEEQHEDAPPEYVLAEETDSESESEYEEDLREK